MTRTAIRLITGAALVGLVALFASRRADADVPATVRWEYRLVEPDREFFAPKITDKDADAAYRNGLNKLGAEGWELIFVRDLRATLIFKRRLP
jgi:hypothetical protein